MWHSFNSHRCWTSPSVVATKQLSHRWGATHTPCTPAHDTHAPTRGHECARIMLCELMAVAGGCTFNTVVPRLKSLSLAPAAHTRTSTSRVTSTRNLRAARQRLRALPVCGFSSRWSTRLKVCCSIACCLGHSQANNVFCLAVSICPLGAGAQRAWRVDKTARRIYKAGGEGGSPDMFAHIPRTQRTPTVYGQWRGRGTSSMTLW